ncbi:MAG: hypothetical protein DRH97_00980 [Chloroflexi bacterium]|nr:MAG: hypothetical protein DRH97_00980 [Chloroflexota bacterium]
MAWVCNVCGAMTKTPQGLFLHKRLAHQMTPQQAKQNPLREGYSCDYCDFVTPYSSSLYRHIRAIHHKEPLPYD